MTSYWHNLTIDDSEWGALRYAIRHMIRYHEEQISSGGGVPHHAHKGTLERLLPRLENADMSLRSETILVRLERPVTDSGNNNSEQPTGRQSAEDDLLKPDG